MSLRLWRGERWSRWRGWLLPVALMTLVPKCALCLLAYAGLGSALLQTGPELCGGSPSLVGDRLSTGALFALMGLIVWRWHHQR